MALSTEDARELADLFKAAATQINDYLNSFNSSDGADYQILKVHAMTLLRESIRMTTEAAGLAIADMEDEAAELKQVTADAKESLRRLQTVRAVIDVAAGLVALATAIVSKDPGGAFNAAKSLRDTVQAATA